MNALITTLEQAMQTIDADEADLCESVDRLTDVIAAAGHGEVINRADAEMAMQALVHIVGELHRARGGA